MWKKRCGEPMSVAILIPLYLQEGIIEVYRHARVYARIWVNAERGGQTLNMTKLC